MSRLVHNTVRLLLSPREKALIKMQADRAVVRDWVETDEDSDTYPEILRKFIEEPNDIN